MSPSCFPEYPRYFGRVHFISFNTVFADREAIADGLNPLTISHTARTSSCGNIGITITTCSVLKGAMRPILTNAHDTMPDMPKTRPQTDINRATSFVL